MNVPLFSIDTARGNTEGIRIMIRQFYKLSDNNFYFRYIMSSQKWHSHGSVEMHYDSPLLPTNIFLFIKFAFNNL